MSIQKQERLLSYNPTIIIATPGRLWELLNERMNPYLTNMLPMIDVLILDEADRMIEDGHFKELKLLLDFIYTKRVEYKKQDIGKSRATVDMDPNKREYKEDIIKWTKESKKGKDFGVKEIERTSKIDLSQVVDLYDEDGIMDEINADNLVIEHDQKEEKIEKKGKGKGKGDKQSQKRRSKEDEDLLAKEYKKMGGIQHIICSATMTIDNSGRITPR